MKIKTSLLTFLIIFSLTASASAQTIKLPAPQKKGGKPLMTALSERKSTRSFSPQALPPQILSNLLWAANGVNRPSGRRTAPSAGDAREIAVYAAMPEGLYLYNAEKNELSLELTRDIRPVTGKQAFVKDAPIVLIFVSDIRKLSRYASLAEFYSATDTGFVSQNVYLYCASEGLATVVLGWVDKEKLAKTMKLGSKERVILTQPVGFPKQ